MSEAAPRPDDLTEIPPAFDRRKKMYESLSPEDQAGAPQNDVEKHEKKPIVPVPEDAPPMQFRHPEQASGC